MFYKWGGSDILSISTLNHYSRILKFVAVILLQEKKRDYLGTFPKRGGGSDILSISTFNHYSRILKVVAVILLQKKYGIIWELFPKGGGVPYSQNFE